jgi:hypothetical protein
MNKHLNRAFALVGVVSVNSNIASADFDPDEVLIESYTETLRELNYRVRAVGSDSDHKD